MSETNRFGEYIANLRNEKNIYLTQLSDGLCDHTMLSRFERGEREPDKLLQNRLLTRLGAVPENYENFLYYRDYCRWEKRQGILHHILEEDIPEAEKQLKEYYEHYDMTMSLEMQFYLAMMAQIRRYQGAEKEELAELVEKALNLTVPEIRQRGIENRVLSLEELNLLLEQIYYDEQMQETVSYKDILSYVKKMNGTQLAMAKIFPKAVYYYYLSCRDVLPEHVADVREVLDLCNEAIELLRNANRMFYLWELLIAKEELMNCLPEEERMTENWFNDLEECRNWRVTLEEIYSEYGVSIAMYEFCYLYVESENYCIGDVIRIRRKMLGMSQKQLSDGICAERTVSRLERNLTEPQREVVRALFDRLNLSTELNRTELVTDNPAAIEMYRELKKQNNFLNFEEVERLINNLKSLVSMESPHNYQILVRKEITNQYAYGLLSKVEYIRKMKEVLEVTVPYNIVVTRGKKYLTNEEISCLQNITLKIDWTYGEMEECVNALIEICEQPKYPENYLRMYQFIMTTVTSHLGNRKEYIRAKKICNKVARLLLINRKLGGMHEILYELAWNLEQCGESKRLLERQIRHCIDLSNMCRDFQRSKAYQSEMENIIIKKISRKK